MELRETILEGTLEVFNRKGIKFTMDDIARTLNISKKTIYTVFEDKNALFMDMVDYLFDSIKESEKQVLADETLNTLEKIRKILGVMPESYKNVDFRQLYMLKDKYPAIYQKVEERLETGWESTISLLEQGIEEGVVRQVSIPLVKMMLEASLEQFFRRDILIRNDMGYVEALEMVVDILVDGIAVHRSEKCEKN
ncbi:MAG: TetR/AcrR family transcriptional regulator [Acetatifactor sp.]|nr:TetR/AcrR family transcriptional regulator [Acetatifactor sp.]